MCCKRLTPYKLLQIFVLVLLFMIFYSLFDLLFSECTEEELKATKELLRRYSRNIQNLKKELLISETKLNERKLIPVSSRWHNKLPIIYLITPTHTRLEQKAELTRLSYTLRLVENIHWIIIEDSDSKTKLVSDLLQKSSLNVTHLNVLTPPEFKMASSDPNWLKPRGVLQRNAGLRWLRKNTDPSKIPGVVYFADDDNTYSLELFDEMRFTQKASVWPVGLVGYLRYESPKVKDGKVVGWFTAWKATRPFAMDMAGFAVNLQRIFDFPEAGFSNHVQRGLQESTFLTGLQLTLRDLEPKASNCSRVLVWHTRTEKSSLKNEEKLKKTVGAGSNLEIEV